ncbi:MAG TPA: transcriptional regulator, partial [Pyrinomonadaceae bacterium]|nr:transcriptional regulator [Pyrinomonadaceae bacterium]
MFPAIGHCYQFGEFTVDCDQKVLLRNGSPLALAPKVFDTLLILVDNNGRLVEKDQLIKQLWPNTFVEESNLTFNIQQVRRVLGDNAREPRFIETVAKRGYRFIAQVTKSQIVVAAPVESESSGSSQLRPKVENYYLWLAITGSILIVGLVVFASWFARNRRAVA